MARGSRWRFPANGTGARLTLSLSPGVYRVITDSRLPNGDLHAMRMELWLEAEQEACVQLQKQAVSLAEQAVDFTLADFQAEARTAIRPQRRS